MDKRWSNGGGKGTFKLPPICLKCQTLIKFPQHRTRLPSVARIAAGTCTVTLYIILDVWPFALGSLAAVPAAAPTANGRAASVSLHQHVTPAAVASSCDPPLSASVLNYYFFSSPFSLSSDSSCGHRVFADDDYRRHHRYNLSRCVVSRLRSFLLLPGVSSITYTKNPAKLNIDVSM